MSFTYEFPRPALAVDCVVFGFDPPTLKVMLIRRGLAPFAGKWALPGGFVQMEESVDHAAARELREETGLQNLFLEQLYTFGDPNRDPRGRVVSVAYYALVKRSECRVQADSDATAAEWFPVADTPALAFDHERIMEMALNRLKGKVRYQPIGFELLPPKFTLTQLQLLYEAILGIKLDKRNFRKKLMAMDLLETLDETEQGVAHRAARLFCFNRRKYQNLLNGGFNFEL